MKLLTLLSILVTLTGIAILFLVNHLYSPKEVAISSIDKSMVGKYVKVTGKVVYARYWKGNLFLKIAQGNSSIQIFAYRNVAGLLKRPFRGETVKVEGVVQEYKGKLELILKKPSDLRRLR